MYLSNVSVYYFYWYYWALPFWTVEKRISFDVVFAAMHSLFPRCLVDYKYVHCLCGWLEILLDMYRGLRTYILFSDEAISIFFSFTTLSSPFHSIHISSCPMHGKECPLVDTEGLLQTCFSSPIWHKERQKRYHYFKCKNLKYSTHCMDTKYFFI